MVINHCLKIHTSFHLYVTWPSHSIKIHVSIYLNPVIRAIKHNNINFIALFLTNYSEQYLKL